MIFQGTEFISMLWRKEGDYFPYNLIVTNLTDEGK